MFLTIIYISIPIFLLAGFLPFYSGKKNDEMSGFIIISLIAFLMLGRDLTAPTDFANYLHMYTNTNTINDALNVYHKNYSFSLLMLFAKKSHVSPELFFYLLPFIYFVFYFLGVKSIFKRLDLAFLAITFFVLSTTFVLLYTNVIRQGLAMSLYVFAIGYFIKKDKIPFLVLFTALFAHSSMFVLVPIFLLSTVLIKKNFNPNKIFVANFIAPLLSFALMPLIVKFTGGYIEKLDQLSSYEYSNKLMIVKITISFVFSVIVVKVGQKNNLFNYNRAYTFLTYNFLIILFVCLITFKFLIISSRFLYFMNSLIPILMVFIFTKSLKTIRLDKKIVIFYFGYIIYGLFIYNFDSIVNQLSLFH